MCGIAGVIATETLQRETLTRVRHMGERLIHRGPDGHGMFHDGPVAFNMRRLSIIDIKGGQQPLFNEDRSVVAIANGEIYNHVDLRNVLRSQGHRFTSGSDCEVIVHLYEQYGLDCVQHMRGMFAFAVWDSQRRRLMLARDRMGEKPLYLHIGPREIYFSSELKGLLAAGCIPFELNPSAIDLYFHYGYVPDPMTPIRGVSKLPAAHILTINADTWEQRQWCYWRMEDIPALTGDPVALIKRELESISELIVHSDVPVGVALSGGLDSSAIAAMASRRYPGRMQAITVGYAENSRHDERNDARALAQYLDLPFHAIELHSSDIAASFPELMFWLDDPIADISAFGSYSVMKEAKSLGLSVMLQGHGGDELFWGYPWVRQAAAQTRRKQEGRNSGGPRFQQYLKLSLPTYWNPWGIKEWLIAGAGGRESWAHYKRDQLSPKEQTIFYDLTPDFRLARKELQSLYSPRFLDNLHTSRAYDPFTVPLPWPDVDVLLTRLICQTYLLENGMAQGDRLSMASSVELRLPLVDYRLVETVIGLRKTSPDSSAPPKLWLREALKSVVPEWVMNRPKRGFTPPLHEWHNALFTAHGEQLHDGFLVNAGVLRAETGMALSKGPYPPEAGAPMSFKALTLELWCRAMSKVGKSSIATCGDLMDSKRLVTLDSTASVSTHPSSR
ncbi:MAG: asparagine synthase (glutamine-hydrolyzing) [Nitrospira sp.]|nr:asparagine synthase (glutamine-hydrolyzing) [Nitrospira sp.]MBS0156921.1 asparagine synthase (glutamine-hydrolyzing) [Nitrospira sp.]MBS0167017.1 asparagine synthase (glutamine-hydrolyzing) [Nitrospira sp.]